MGRRSDAVSDRVELVGELVGRDRRSSEPAVVAGARSRTYSYFDTCNTAAKAGNVLRHVGVRPGDTVWIEPRPDPEVVFTFLGAAQLGAATRFVGPHDAVEGYLGADEPRAVVVHAAAEAAADPAPGTSLVVYGDEPAGADVTHWETEVWSENPAAPPAPVEPEDTVLTHERTAFSHRWTLGTAEAVRAEYSIDADTTTVLRASIADPRAVAAAVIAPLVVGGTIALPDGDAPLDASSVEGDESASTESQSSFVAVGDAGPEERRIPLASVPP